MIKISPSLLAADVTRLGEEIRNIEYKADMLHIDVMDGHFVPNLSYGVSVVKGIRKITHAFLDVHLMIDNPGDFIKPFYEAGSDLITIHIEANDDIGECLKKIHSFGIRAGLAIKPDTNPKEIIKYLPDTDMILQMTVYPGFGGQGMVEKSLDNIKEIRNLIGDMDLEVDGGIYTDNCEKVVEKGANVIVSGTGIFKAGNSADEIDKMRKKCELYEEKY